MDVSSNVGSLEEESMKRKERLRALKRKLNSTEEKDNNGSVNKAVTLPKPKFRSYKPSDTELKELVLPTAKPGSVETQIKSQLDAANQRDVIQTVDVANLAPRKPDWDLKRDAAKKLERLEKRTQRAIAELIRERLRTEHDDWAVTVAMGAEAVEQGAAVEE